MENARRWRLGSPPVLILAKMAVTTSKEPPQRPPRAEWSSGGHMCALFSSFVTSFPVCLKVL